MALEISKSESAKLTIQGTSIELDSAYARIELAAAANGKDMQMGMYYYENAAAYESGSKVLTIAEMKGLYNAEADVESGEKQTIAIASEKVKAKLEEDGYSVSVVDI